MTPHAVNSINLSPGQARFALLIEAYPKFSVYWNWEKKVCDPDAIENALPAMSHGEQIMMKFFWSVWLHHDKGFDLIEAASILNKDHMKIVTDWMIDPFWP